MEIITIYSINEYTFINLIIALRLLNSINLIYRNYFVQNNIKFVFAFFEKKLPKFIFFCFCYLAMINFAKTKSFVLGQEIHAHISSA